MSFVVNFDRGFEDGYFGGYSNRLADNEDYIAGYTYGDSLARAFCEAARYESEARAHYAALEAEYYAELEADPFEGDRWIDDGGRE